MPRRVKPITQSDFLVTIEGLQVYWETFSGVDDQAQTSTYSNGLDRDQQTLVGPAVLQPVTFTRGYDPEQDSDIVAFWKEARGSLRNASPKTVFVQPIEYQPDPVALGAPIVLYNFRASRLSLAQVDKTSQGVSTLTLEGVFSYWDQQPTSSPVSI